MAKKKIALIGLGYTSQITHLKCILYSKNSILTTIYDERKNLKKKIRSKYNIKNELKNLDDLNNYKNEIDIVVLCVDRYRQPFYLEKILSLKFHVICEKPFSINSDMSKKLVKLSKKHNLSCLISLMKVHDAGTRKFRNEIKKKQLNNKTGNFNSSLLGGDLRNGAFWRIKTNEKLKNGDEKRLVHKSIKKKYRLSYLIFLNRYHHSLNLIFYLFDVKIKNIKKFTISQIDNFSLKISFQYKKIFFNLNFGNNMSKKWIEFYNFKNKNNEYRLELQSPFNVQNSGILTTKKNKLLKQYSNNDYGYSWSFKNQFEYFLKNYKKRILLNNIEQCYKEQIFLEKSWKKLK